ncbi:8837_t:CDS:2, partial [Dentiscutata erythropus]
MQSTQRVESMNSIIKNEVDTKTTLLNLCKTIQTKLDYEAQHQRFSEYRNTLFTQGLPSLQSVFFKSIQDEIEKYLTSELAFPPKAHKYSEGYLEDEYDTLQASLETIIKMVNYENILEIWRLVLKHWYFNPMQESSISPITDTTAEHETQEYAYGFGIAKSGLKFAIDNGLVDEFVRLISRFIENRTGVRSNFAQQDSLQNLNIEQEKNSRPKKHTNVKTDDNNIKLKLGTRH